MALHSSKNADSTTRKQLSRLEAEGKLRKVYTGIYTDDLESSIKAVVRRELFQLCALLAPDAVISHRSVFETVPETAVYLSGPGRRIFDLGVVQLRVEPGPGPLPGDLAIPTNFGVAHRSSEARGFLENLQRARVNELGERKTLDAGALETLLESRISRGTEGVVNQIRDQAREVAEALGMQKEFGRLDLMIGGLLQTKTYKFTAAAPAARASGRPVDTARIDIFQKLKQQLVDTPVHVPAADPNADPAVQAFIESYFSNFIEGTEFTLEEAEDIVLKGHPLIYRQDDSHDVIGTYEAILISKRNPVFAENYEAFEALLRQWNKKVLHTRNEKGPGEFKSRGNRAGLTIFVEPELVKGTLMKGYEEIMALPPGPSRAVMAMFVVAEVHPFADGNGRTARLAMNCALSAMGLTRIIIPTVYRDDYLTALKAISLGDNCAPYVRTMTRAADFSRWLDCSSIENCTRDLIASKAMDKSGVLRFEDRAPAPAPVAPAAADTSLDASETMGGI